MALPWPLQRRFILSVLSGNSPATQPGSWPKRVSSECFLNLTALADLLLSRQPRVHKQLSEETGDTERIASAEIARAGVGTSLAAIPPSCTSARNKRKPWNPALRITSEAPQ